MSVTTTINGGVKTAIVSKYHGASRGAQVRFDTTASQTSPFSIGTRLAYMRGGSPTASSDSKFVSIDGSKRYYFRISAYNHAGMSSPRMYSVQLRDATPRDLPAKGGQLVDIWAKDWGSKMHRFQSGSATCRVYRLALRTGLASV